MAVERLAKYLVADLRIRDSYKNIVLGPLYYR